MNELKNLEPQSLWNNFYELTRIPRPSSHLEKVQKFLLDWATVHGVEAFKDNAENIVMKKPATIGFENRKKVVMQAHMDMVPQKIAGSNHNFVTDPIETFIDGDWVKAKGTTLGSDDGIGVAAIMAVMENNSLQHGPLEALITSDEETCMYGVTNLSPDTLSGTILLNFDNETLGEFVVGSAGGVNITASLSYNASKTNIIDDVAVKITIKGLRGGHSGLEINDNRANANKLMARFLQSAVVECDARLAWWMGGNMRNAIPRESEAVLTVPSSSVDELQRIMNDFSTLFSSEYSGREQIEMFSEIVELPSTQVPDDICNNIISSVIACHDGVLRNIPSMPHIVETSSNLAIVDVKPDNAQVLILARSSSESMMEYVCNMIESCYNLAGMRVEYGGRYGAWQPNFKSEITSLMTRIYRDMFSVEPVVQVVHAGLECSLIGKVYPNMDLVSFGPTLRSPHTPDERCLIPSVTKFWEFLKELLRQIPEDE